MKKIDRHNKILEIISSKEIDTQEELVETLNSLSFNVTQATVSRDIQELGLIKISGETKKYKYALMQKDDGNKISKQASLFKNSVTKIDDANNIVVIKTLVGNAGAVGAIIDNLNILEILGSVAGDDTIIIVTRTDKDAKEVKRILTNLL